MICNIPEQLLEYFRMNEQCCIECKTCNENWVAQASEAVLLDHLQNIHNIKIVTANTITAGTLFVDVHEDKLQRMLTKENIEYQVEALPVGDFVKSNVVIERKTIEDFIGSVRSGRLWTQLLQMQENYEKCYLIISGSFKNIQFLPHLQGWTVEHHLGALASISVRYNVKIIQVDNDTQMAKLICKIMDKSFDGKVPSIMDTSVMKVRDKLTDEDIKFKMLMCLPQISYDRALKICEHVDIILTNKEKQPLKEEDIIGIVGIGERLREILLKFS
jgi:Fanconi anemia group M protein